MKTESRGIDNKLLKGARVGIVLFGWIIIAVTSRSMEELFKSGFIYCLGLVYDYLCLYDASVDEYGNNLMGQKILSSVGIGYSILMIIFMLLGLFGVFNSNNVQGVAGIANDAYLFGGLPMKGERICIALGIYPMIAMAEFIEPFCRRTKAIQNNNAIPS